MQLDLPSYLPKNLTSYMNAPLLFCCQYPLINYLDGTAFDRMTIEVLNCCSGLAVFFHMNKSEKNQNNIKYVVFFQILYFSNLSSIFTSKVLFTQPSRVYLQDAKVINEKLSCVPVGE